MAHDVFISHSNSDKAAADAMCLRLEQVGIRCWIAPRDVRPGRNWGSEIIRGLENARLIIVVLSASANSSRSVIKEVELAFGKGIVIITVRTEDVVPSEALAFFLSSEQWLDMITPPLDAHFDWLVRTVKDHLVEQGWKEAWLSRTRVPIRVPGDATKEHPFINSIGMRFVRVPGTNVLFSVWETRVKDYQIFCTVTGRPWKKPTFSQTGDHPAVNVSWEDAKEFCEWLSTEELNRYRLPTDHEWSCAVGIGDRENADATPQSKAGQIANVYPWGEQWPPPTDAGNYCGEECQAAAALDELKLAGHDTSNWRVIEGFNDGSVFTAAVGVFRPSELGIYDLGGNVWEWCQDEIEPGSCWRVLRGGSWNGGVVFLLLSSDRFLGGPAVRRDYIGFRVAVEVSSSHR
jgi:Sulfatase-modifying factor enzyme 1/TIR domain